MGKERFTTEWKRQVLAGGICLIFDMLFTPPLADDNGALNNVSSGLSTLAMQRDGNLTIYSSTLSTPVAGTRAQTLVNVVPADNSGGRGVRRKNAVAHSKVVSTKNSHRNI